MAEQNLDASDVSSPFVGLIPFDEVQAEYFFGREKDTQVVATNLRASRLTVLYGGSGVGKSSVILAGVVPYLRERSKMAAIPGAPPDFLCIIIREWVDDPVVRMRVGMEEAVKGALADGSMPNLTRREVDQMVSAHSDNREVASFLLEWTALTKTKFLFIFDQFEDFFAKKNAKFLSGQGSFGDEFPAALNNERVTANYLISMRDDSTSKLDFFRGRLGPLNNLLRLHHLDRALTEEAIRRPVQKFNQKTAANFQIDDDLVKEVIEEVRVGNIKLDTQGKAKEEIDETLEIAAEHYGAETPYLQLVLMRLWQHKKTQDTQRLSLDTLVDPDKLGGVQKIVETHLDEVMNKMSEEDQKLASEFIHFTVTRSGTKIPSEAVGLAEWAELPDSRIPDIERILETLSTGDSRVFKTVTSHGSKIGKSSYEVAHDALAPAVLSWRTRFIERERLAQLEKAESDRLVQLEQKESIIGWIKKSAPVLVFLGIVIFYIARTSGYWSGEYEKAFEKDLVIQELNQEREIEKVTLESREANLAEAVKVFVSLARGAELPPVERDAEIAKLKELVEAGKLTDDDKKLFTALAGQIPDTSTRNQVKQIMGNPAEVVQVKRVFLHYLDPRQKDAEPYLKRLLTQGGFTVPKSETFNIPLNSSQVRFFHEGDAELAGTVVGLLQAWAIAPVRARLVPGYESKVPPGQMELWLATTVLAVPSVAIDDFSLYATPGVKSSLMDVKVVSGETVERQLCVPRRDKFDGKTGKWCRVYYNGHYGWTLDASLEGASSKE